MLKQGKIEDLTKLHNGWILGDFINDPNFNTAGSYKFEIKWSTREKGYTHKSDRKIGANDNSFTLIVLISGSLIQMIDGQDYELKYAGDYLLYSPNQPHQVTFLNDSILITIRWYK